MRNMDPHDNLTVSGERRSGFTLVELLVSIGLVLLIMLLMASVYGLATDTFARQKGMAENDQQARALSSVLRGDLRARTAEIVQAYLPNEDPEDPDGKNGKTRGYLSYSENDPDNDTDDALALTVEVDVNDSRDNSSNSLFTGRATLIYDLTNDPRSDTVDNDGDGNVDNDTDDLNGDGRPDYLETRAWLGANPYQPEADDAEFLVNNGNLTSLPFNNTGKSPVAEVSYFLRGNRLYRRVLLIREPYDTTERLNPGSVSSVNDYMTSQYPGTPTSYAPFGSGEFYRDFDYSAFLQFSGGTAVGPQLVISKEALNLISTNPLSESIANPNNRFGHNPYDRPAGLQPRQGLGRPREFLHGPDNQPGVAGTDDNNNGIVDDYGELGWPGSDDVFIGRFTMQETADSNFGYPGRSNSGPFTNGSHTLDSNNQISAFGNETFRRGEDILMTNVISFDVKIWDNIIGDFVDVGHSLSNGAGDVGDYHINNQINRSYGNRFDTWHHDMGSLTSSAGVNQQFLNSEYEWPPYGINLLDDQPGIAGTDDDGGGDIDVQTNRDFDNDGNQETLLDTADLVSSLSSSPPLDRVVPRVKAIQIKVKYMDPRERLVRQVTIVQSLE